MADIEFVSGLIVKAPRPQAPEYVKCSISFHRAELRECLGNRTDEWINIDVKEAHSGKWYASVNNWSPDRNSMRTPAREPVTDCPQPDQGNAGDFADDDLPF